MYLYNYSGLRAREKKIYSVAGTQISATGISVDFLKVVLPCALFTTLIGVVICFIARQNFFNVLNGSKNVKFLIGSVGSGVCLGLALWYIRVESYRLYEYLIAYLKPKKTYHNLNTRDQIHKLYKIKVNGLIKSDF